ncbi:SUMO-activating enzyme subunit 1-like [Paramacrobiotus metropolitanus]|uniref:SUMO-activating enzyme subunit 1-like n=1 Tax=Paramacrobiotus metropolitanus TaxID=2943436 RepID=UPI0024459094|nr:SUMO-activating enzyme subunit 1-like [Paramacrobiotus metropolitanus]
MGVFVSKTNGTVMEVVQSGKKRPLEDSAESSQETTKKPKGELDRFRPTNLYDRQIRLWGWEAQQRLMKSRLLMYGLNGTGAEVLKNLLLGGIRYITVLDAASVTEPDLSTNFFLRKQDVGLNRAVASADRARVLNPMCTLEVLDGDVTIINTELVKHFDLVLVNGASIKDAVHIAGVCRSLHIPVYISQMLGFHAFFVNDLNQLDFEIPPSKPNTAAAPKADAKSNGTTASTSKMSNGEAEVCTFTEDSVNTEPQTLHITVTPLETLLSSAAVQRSGAACPMPKRSLGMKRIDPYLNMEMVLLFVEQYGRYPAYQTVEDDLPKLLEIVKGLQKDGDTRVLEPAEFLKPDTNFACAVFGATLAQELITVLTRRGYPIFNLYYLAAMDAMGSREYVQ